MMQPLNLTRAQKIKMLKAIMAGKESINVLKPNKILVVFQCNDDPVLFKCGGEILTEAEMEERNKKFKDRIVVKW